MKKKFNIFKKKGYLWVTLIFFLVHQPALDKAKPITKVMGLLIKVRTYLLQQELPG